MRLAYADPPYPGCAHLYKDHPDYAGEVDHVALIRRLETEFDGYVLHTSVPALATILPLFNTADADTRRICAWVKPFAAFKANVPVAYTWEPVIIEKARTPDVYRSCVRPLRDHLAESITMERGLTGAKPEAVCWWAFEIMGADPLDELVDLFPGTGAVTRAWESWKVQRNGLWAETRPLPCLRQHDSGASTCEVCK